MEKNVKSCILLFSGGRDSTIAAVRLSPIVERLTLVTVTSDHLSGIDVVQQRLAELKTHLPPSTKWLQARQPTRPFGLPFRVPTCLPCHCFYTAIGITLAKHLNTEFLAFGYTGYQSEWPEQTPYAIERLKWALESRGIRLLLPVYDITQKSDAIVELIKYNLSTDTLEQKCSKQQFNEALDPPRLKEEIKAWEQVLLEILEVLDRDGIDKMTETSLGDLNDS